MKTKMKLTIGLAALLLAGVTAQAQTNAPQTFFNTAYGYLTSFNTNYTYTGVTYEMATGYKQVTGVNAASTLDAQRDIGLWNIGAAFQFSGVGSAVNAAELQGGYAIIEHYDTKVDLDLRGGYDWNMRTEVVEPALFLSKKLTANTFLKTGLSAPVYLKGSFNRTPTVYIETGFTF